MFINVVLTGQGPFVSRCMGLFWVFFFNDTATTEIYTRSIVGSVRCVQETGLYPYSCFHVLNFDPISVNIYCPFSSCLLQSFSRFALPDQLIWISTTIVKTVKHTVLSVSSLILGIFFLFVIPMYSALIPVSYTHLRAHETSLHLVCRLLLEKKKNS
eukprot:TRINITY_DN50343_c0_g1_i1.p1 TRINITY_DN50343_c0_g1~~TRINITY_DN50343_c0_g1_i1.p1  ORF type:complete len:157 (+),score=24.24 TRINITY_DN50343_c0_g1_i1:30-500(+)